VRVIDDEGNQVGMMKTPDAVKFAQERDLDLVEVAPEAKPPVCRVLDYSKYKYEQAQKLKQARKHQQQITIREIKFRPKIAQHDYDTKKHHVERFLRHKDKVKITIMFRGREVTHPERGVAILDRLAEELAALCIVEQRPTQDGRNMTMMLGPSKAVLAGKADGAENGTESNGAESTDHADGGAPAADHAAGATEAVQPEASPNGAVAAAQTEVSPGGAADGTQAAASSNAASSNGAADGAADGTQAAVSPEDAAATSPAAVSPENASDSSDADTSPEGEQQSADGGDGVPDDAVS
jgi:translation initiation factor IF-3